jgi:formyltetrahydrofolate hydrolase
MAANGDTAHFILSVSDDGTIVAQCVTPLDESKLSAVGVSVTAYTGPDVLAKADAARLAIGCLLAYAPVTGHAREPE